MTSLRSAHPRASRRHPARSLPHAGWLSYGWGMDMTSPWTTPVLTHLGQPSGLPALPTAAWTTPTGLPTCPHPLLLLSASASPGSEPQAIGAFGTAPLVLALPAAFTRSCCRFQPDSVPDSSGLPCRISRNRHPCASGDLRARGTALCFDESASVTDAFAPTLFQHGIRLAARGFLEVGVQPRGCLLHHSGSFLSCCRRALAKPTLPLDLARLAYALGSQAPTDFSLTRPNFLPHSVTRKEPHPNHWAEVGAGCHHFTASTHSGPVSVGNRLKHLAPSPEVPHSS